MSPEARLPESAADRRRLGRQLAVDSLVRAALVPSSAEVASRRVRRTVRPARGWSWRGRLAAAAAVLIAASAGVVIFRLQHDPAGLRVESGDVFGAAGRRAAGQFYRAGTAGARLAVPDGGRLELAAGTGFRPTAGGLDLAGGELIGRGLARAGFRAGPLSASAAAAGTSLMLMRATEPGADEAAVVVMSGRVRASGGAGSAELAPGQDLACGWGVEPRPLTVGEIRELLEKRRSALTGRGESERYDGILGEYDRSLAEMQRELRSLGAGTTEAEWLARRIESLADCAAAHRRRVPQLRADAAEHTRLDHRQAFLDRAVQASCAPTSPTAAVHGPESPACGGPLASAPPDLGGQVRLSWLGR
jgi:hypothetical protein